MPPVRALRNRAALIAATVVVGSTGCTFLVDFVTKDASCEGESCFDPRAGTDASTSGRDVDTPPIPDGAPDASLGVDARCCGCVDAPFTGRAEGFLFIDASPGDADLLLTREEVNAAGAAFWNTPANLTAFEVRFEVSVTCTAMPADGVAFVAMSGLTPKDVTCAGGSALCLIGSVPRGFALVLRTYRNTHETMEAPYLALVTIDRRFDSDAGPHFLDGGAIRVPDATVRTVDATSDPPPEDSWHAYALHVKDGYASVTMDGKTLLSKVPVPKLADGGYWGFAAATGSHVEQAAIRNVYMVDLTATCDGGG